jgi:hypothetical protein
MIDRGRLAVPCPALSTRKVFSFVLFFLIKYTFFVESVGQETTNGSLSIITSQRYTIFRQLLMGRGSVMLIISSISHFLTDVGEAHFFFLLKIRVRNGTTHKGIMSTRRGPVMLTNTNSSTLNTKRIG